MSLGVFWFVVRESEQSGAAFWSNLLVVLSWLLPLTLVSLVMPAVLVGVVAVVASPFAVLTPILIGTITLASMTDSLYDRSFCSGVLLRAQGATSLPEECTDVPNSFEAKVIMFSLPWLSPAQGPR